LTLESEIAALESPFLVQEHDDPEFMAFLRLDEILDDRKDCLWGERFHGWDARGIRFELQRVAHPRSWTDRLLGTFRESLVILEISAGPDLGVCRPQLEEWLTRSGALAPEGGSSLTFRELILTLDRAGKREAQSAD
jgi:hypothetical protein